MKSLAPLLAITLLAVSFVPVPLLQASPESSDAGAVKAKLKQMETSWGNALLDKDKGVAVIKELVADDFSGVTSKGKIQSKSDLLDELRTDKDTLSSSTTDSMEVHVYGDKVATVCGTSTESGKDKDGKAFTHRYGWVDTWMERKGKWECIAEAGMLMPEKK